MKQKTKQKQPTASAVLAPKIKISDRMMDLVVNQSMVIESVINGTAYMDKNRWHGKTSVYDVHRISRFLNSSVSSGSLDMKRFHSLAKEIPTFFKAIGPNLTRMIASYKA